MSPALAGGFLTTGPPGKSTWLYLKVEGRKFSPSGGALSLAAEGTLASSVMSVGLGTLRHQPKSESSFLGSRDFRLSPLASSISNIFVTNP